MAEVSRRKLTRQKKKKKNHIGSSQCQADYLSQPTNMDIKLYWYVHLSQIITG